MCKNTRIHVAFLNNFLRRHVTNSKTSQKDMYVAPHLTKTVTGPNCVFLRPSPSTNKPPRLSSQPDTFLRRTPSRQHTHTHTHSTAAGSELSCWHNTLNCSCETCYVTSAAARSYCSFPETQHVTYSAVSSGLYGFQPLILVDVI